MISALILAAGQSKRMGQPKMLLPWGETTVLENVIATFKAAGIEAVIVITGGDRERVEALVGDTAQTLFNPNYAQGEMLSSVQAGLAFLRATSPKSAFIHNIDESLTESGFGGGREGDAVLIGLGDQPQVQERCVRLVVDEYRKNGTPLVVPSFQRRRGHPWLVAHPYWDEILRMRAPESLRDFLNRHAQDIRYVEIDNSSILQDLDTPEDYLKSRS
jgi:molybdenum cofactor cytidylyltransferase